MLQGFSDGGGAVSAAELAQLQSTMHTIEAACTSFQMHINPAAAEATILSLSQSPHPYKVCKFILENSQVPNARFQAAGAIRNAAIREWGFLSADDRRNLVSFCLCYVMQHASSSEGYVQAKVSSVAAQLIKRGWLDFPAAEKEAFFTQVHQAMLGIHGVDVQYIGINFLESLVSEFSPSTSSAMGLPREFHEQCRKSLELDYLKIFYCWTRDTARCVAEKIVEYDPSAREVKVCTAALRLMLQVLNWEFQFNTSSTRSLNVYSPSTRQDAALTNRTECVLVQPGPAWCDVLVLNGDIVWLLNLYMGLRQKFTRDGFSIDCPIAVSARKLIVQFCSLTGSVFPLDNRQLQENHLLQLLAGIMQWIDPPDAIAKEIECGKSESEMLDGCRALLSIATVTNPAMFHHLLRSIRPFGTLTFLSNLMCEVIKNLMTSTTDEETWSWVARDILLDTWSALLVPMDNSDGKLLLPPEGMDAAAGLFFTIVESEIKAASASAFNDDDDDTNYLQASISAMDERLTSYALIARAAIGSIIPFLTGLFTERFSRLHQGRGTIDPTETLEELYSLLLIAGHVLADEGEGETPLIPASIKTHFAEVQDADKNPVIVLSSSMVKFAEQSLDTEIRNSFFSPRLTEALIWFLARWALTYLMSPEQADESSCKVILTYFDEYNYGKFVLDIIVRVAMMTFISYPGESNLQGFLDLMNGLENPVSTSMLFPGDTLGPFWGHLTCNQLLHALVRQKNIRAQLVALDSWRELANAFANEKTLFTLNSIHQRSLAQTLVLSASGLRNADNSNQFVMDLMRHMTMYFVEISSKNDLKNIAEQPDIILSVTCLLERLRGAASASEPRMQKSLYEMGLSVLNSILVLLEAYKNESAVVYLLLKFVVVWVDGQITYLEAQETAVVVDFCMRLLQLYSSHNIGKISLSLSSNLNSDAKTEKYKDLRALLQLLSSLCSKDLIDFSSASFENQGTNISQVVFYGLHIITPLISLELLKYPKLCHDYFSLLSHMLEVYPEMVGQLNHEAFTHILDTLDFGLHHQDSEVVNMCLRALRALASYHYKEAAVGRAGIHSRTTGHKTMTGELEDGIFSRFLRSLLQLLLFEDYSPDLVGAAADALFPLILCEQGVYQKLGNELIERQTNPSFKSRLANALHSLTSSNQLACTLDRVNHQRFRKNLTRFLIDVRGFLRTM